MDAGTGFTSQVYEISPVFLHKVIANFSFPQDFFFYASDSLPKSSGYLLNQEWIMEQWDKNYYITSLAGASNGSALVIMSKGKLN